MKESKQDQFSIMSESEIIKDSIAPREKMHEDFDVKSTGIPKGAYFFKSHQEADKHREDCMKEYVKSMRIKNK